MGILNCTPDSFSDGGLFFEKEKAIIHGIEMWKQGAEIIDIGGESSRPGALSVSESEELQRVIPVIQALKAEIPDILISVDTVKAKVAKEAVWAGAKIINDINGLKDEEMLETCVDLYRSHGIGIVIMHMKGIPQTMQVGDLENPMFFDEIKTFLADQITKCMKKGIHQDALIIDPGIGFGKTVEQNIEILARINELKSLGCQILMGTSRKSFIGQICQKEKDQRLIGSVTSAVISLWEGANIIRVHDVAETLDAVKIVEQCLKFKNK